MSGKLLRYMILALLLALLLQGTTAALDLDAWVDSHRLKQALPQSARELMTGVEPDESLEFSQALGRLWENAKATFSRELRRQLGASLQILAAALLCATAAAFAPRMQPMVRIVGILAIVLLTAGDLQSLLGLGSSMMSEMASFSKILMPVLAAAGVASGSMTASGTIYVAVMFAVELLVSLFAELMTPLIWADAALLTAGTIAENPGLCKLSRALKNGVSLCLKWILGLFTGYLMVAGVISGTADAMTVKTVRLAVSSIIPVAGGAIADAAEAVVAGAGIVRSATGIFGILGILAIGILPFARLGMQYLSYRLAALLAVVAGAEGLDGILEGMGEVFSMMLALVGAGAALLLIGIFAAAAGVRA